MPTACAGRSYAPQRRHCHFVTDQVIRYCIPRRDGSLQPQPSFNFATSTTVPLLPSCGTHLHQLSSNSTSPKLRHAMARNGHRMLCWQPLLARGYTGIPHCLDFDSIDVSHELCAVFPRTAVAVPAGLFLPHVARRVRSSAWHDVGPLLSLACESRLTSRNIQTPAEAIITARHCHAYYATHDCTLH